ncbi:T9SS type A sorting domain-containing protein, partial [Candidatus Poribacteria bacterium]|nr:T9SS type A sorting domain-containing protein [Candidatus Poribacteria bacterium]
DLHDNAITDVYHLKNLTNLEILDLRENHIFDFTPIAGIIENLIEYDSDTQTEPPPDLKPVPRYNKPDVNRDNVVDVTDLVLIAANFDDPDFNAIEQMNIYPDVNGDGEINIIDLLIVASEIGPGNAAPTFKKGSVEFYYLTSENLTQWIRLAKQLNIEDTNLKNGIVVLEHLLTLLSSDDTLPKVTTLLPNYPNPFNPETWIPFHLATPAKVSIFIYSVNGTLIRKLSLGFLPAGIYIDKTRAAYWNGEDELGESVSSGIYFFTFKAKDYISTRKVVITK